MGDAPPEDHCVLHEGEEDEHHAGQEPHLHGCHGVTHGDPSALIEVVFFLTFRVKEMKILAGVICLSLRNTNLTGFHLLCVVLKFPLKLTEMPLKPETNRMLNVFRSLKGDT